MSPRYIKLIIATGATLLTGGAVATTANIEPAKEAIAPYKTTYVDDANLPKGQTKIVAKGQTGIKVEHYTITYEDGVETKRELDRTETSREPTSEVIAKGTYVPPQPRTETASCQNGTYVNSAGNTVCRPSKNNTGDATAICADGTYSYSQSRRGTCSHHGGISSWL